MRQVVGHAASLEAYRIVEMPMPELGAGQIRIAVRSCGMGFADALLATGGYQVAPPFPFTPGSEFAGIVEAIGEGVERFAVGDRVMAGEFSGGLADYATVSEHSAWMIPGSLDFPQAAGFRGNYLTAMHALADRAALRPGERLLVFGAGGGLGAAAVQVGNLLGAHVIAVGSTVEKRRFAIDRGARHALDASPEGWRTRLEEACGGSAPDVVFDPVCGPLFEPAFRSLGWRGRYLVVGFAAGDVPRLAANLPLLKGAALVGADVRQFSQFEPQAAAGHIGQLLKWAGEGCLIPAVGRQFDVEEFDKAMKFALSGEGVGKTIIDMDAAAA